MPTGKLKLVWHAQTTELLLKMHTRKNKNTFLPRCLNRLTTKDTRLLPSHSQSSTMTILEPAQCRLPRAVKSTRHLEMELSSKKRPVLITTQRVVPSRFYRETILRPTWIKSSSRLMLHLHLTQSMWWRSTVTHLKQSSKPCFRATTSWLAILVLSTIRPPKKPLPKLSISLSVISRPRLSRTFLKKYPAVSTW